jgi:hypothetical protein
VRKAAFTQPVLTWLPPLPQNTFAQFAAGSNAGAQAKPAGDGGGGGTADVGGSGTATDSGVQNLGMVGRGTKRINLQAVQVGRQTMYGCDRLERGEGGGYYLNSVSLLDGQV